MKQRILEIIKTLKEVIKETNLNISDEKLFEESLTTYRGEEMNKNKSSKFQKSYSQNPSKPASDKQIAYAQELADKKNIDLKITGGETSLEISKIIEGLKRKTK